MNLAIAHQQNPHWWIVQILPDDVTRIEAQAQARMENGARMGWRTRSAGRDTTWEISGLAGELAAHLVYNLPLGKITSSSKRELNSGDLADWAEVKSSRGQEPFQWDLICNEDHLKENRAYVHTITCWWPQAVAVTGWAWGREFRERGRRGTHGVSRHGVWILRQGTLRDPKDLFDEMAWRRHHGLG